MDATHAHGTQAHPATATTGPPDGQPHHLWQCGPQTLATPWPIIQLLAQHNHAPTAHATPEQHQWLHMHFELASADVPARVTWKPDTTAEWRIHRETFHTKHTAVTYPLLAKHRSTTPEAPACPVKHRCSRGVPETRTIERTTYNPKRAYVLQYIHNYLVQGHERNCDYVQMNAAATEIIHRGIGVYAVPRCQPATTTPWATTAGGACVHAYQPTAPCRLPRPDDQNTIFFADVSGMIGLTSAAGGNYGQTQQANCGNTS